MNDKKKNENVSRRNFLKLGLAGGTAVVGASVLRNQQPWENYDEENSMLRNVNELKADWSDLKKIAHFGTLAASGHNTQPWKFVIEENAIEIRPDFSRSLPVVDPEHRELWISLGCALENMKVAAREFGYAYDVDYPENAETGEIRLTLRESETEPSETFEAIAVRQNTRANFDEQVVDDSILFEVRSVEIDVTQGIDIFTDDERMELIRKMVYEGNLAQYANKDFVDELNNWLRFNKGSALRENDGLFSRCSGNPEVPSWLGKIFVTTMAPDAQSKSDDEKMIHSAGYMILSTKGNSVREWVLTGELYERVALVLTKHGVRTSLMNQPIEVPELRENLYEPLELFGEQPQLILRFGYGELMPYSLRRYLDEVLI